MANISNTEKMKRFRYAVLAKFLNHEMVLTRRVITDHFKFENRFLVREVLGQLVASGELILDPAPYDEKGPFTTSDWADKFRLSPRCMPVDRERAHRRAAIQTVRLRDQTPRTPRWRR